MLNVFTKHGITLISPEVGDKFDPKLHEAMFEAPLPDTKSGDIIQVSAEGVMLHDRLLRPAKVGVSKKPQKTAEEECGKELKSDNKDSEKETKN